MFLSESLSTTPAWPWVLKASGSLAVEEEPLPEQAEMSNEKRTMSEMKVIFFISEVLGSYY